MSGGALCRTDMDCIERVKIQRNLAYDMENPQMGLLKDAT